MTICYTPTLPHLAYEVHGAGAETLIVVPGWVSHLAFDWDTPETRAFHERLAVTRRVVRYDKRGTGLSERPPGPDTYALDTRVRDLGAVMDAAGLQRADLFGWSEGGKSVYIAAHLPNARLETLEGEHHVPFLGDAAAITNAVNGFLTCAPDCSCGRGESSPAAALSPREVEVLRLVAEGLPNRGVAERLSLSVKTVNRHLVNIYTKLGVNTRGAAIAHAFRHGFMQP